MNRFGQAAVAVILFLGTAGEPARGQALVRVPADAVTLDRAITSVSDGGTIEMAAGTYVPPSTGFRISRGKSFTIRPAPGATVILDGQGARPILRIDEADASRVITIRDLQFRNGVSTITNVAGGITVRGATFVCVGCQFVGNAALPEMTGGGAILASENAQVQLTDSLFEDNTAILRGGAIDISRADLVVERCQFLSNRVNIVSHAANAAGGALHVVDGTARIVLSRFNRNEAAFSGGAIVAIGLWRDPLSQPATTLEIVNSTFQFNVALNNPCCPTPQNQPTSGGAINAEDHTTYTITDSRFHDNAAQQGGAIGSYRALGEIEDSIFTGNQTIPGAPEVGGAIQLVSNDFSDGSTNFGATNRRPVALTVRGTAFFFNSAGNGGCIFIAGDQSRVLGNGVPATGGLANRARLTVEESLFHRCDATPRDGNPARGGAIFANLAHLDVSGSMFIDSRASGPGARGGAIEASARSRASITRTTFAGNSATVSGGALQVGGSELIVDRGRFHGNEISPGVAEPITSSNGAAIFSIPQLNADGSPLSRDVTGVVRNSDFFGQLGLPIWETDLANGPINALRYDSNRFFNTSHGSDVFQNTANGFFGGLDVADLNALVVQRPNGTTTVKSQVPNMALANEPRVGDLLAAPLSIPLQKPPGTEPFTRNLSYLGYTWLGGNAQLNNGILNDQVNGSPADPGTYELQVDGTFVDAETITVDGPTPCEPSTNALCLNDGRFEVKLDFRTPNGNGQARVVPEGTVDSGLFHFGNPDNWELLVKVLSNCGGPTDRFWVLAAATTNLEYTLQVTDTLAGVSKTYFNPLGVSAPAIVDTDAFNTCNVAPPASHGVGPAALADPTAPRVDLSTDLRVADVPSHHRRSWQAPIEKGGCVEGPEALCLNDNRFRVEVDFAAQNGLEGSAQVAPPGTVDSGLFFFFNPTNFEMLVKVLDNCNGPTNRFWVFAAATTNVAFTLRVTDTQSGEVMEYENPLGNQADAITDTDAFATCP